MSMKLQSACFAAVVALTASLGGGLVGCGSDDAQTTSTTTSSTSSGGGSGGDGGSTVSAGGAGGVGGTGGEGGQGGSGGSAMACEPLPEPCSTCLYNECQERYCDCYGNSACSALLFTCLSQCASGDQACVQTCATQHPNGVSDAALLGACSDQACSNVCPTAGIVVNGCTECLFTECPTQMNACFAEPACAAAVECVQMCPPNNFNCISTCVGGNQNAQTVLSCAVQNCSGQCQ
ncbi:hypothetical protein [Chondromyces crocatus]|uniref:Secreted protein n=1 Tax=Chondromyces crocatus TaxID=52 RepID=A0A0K1ENW6_CHOCO|nr:hypothetical protein [Chondromyces crocatus]AKT42590.1 uncharacterized protein CMC5_068170 [Chondromyces crocatus]